jgi:chorismate synthase
MLRFLTAGESHGQALVATLDGCPAGLALDPEAINRQLKRRQGGYGRGRRMAIESDRAEWISGVRHGVTTGAPIALIVRNKDWVNWQQTMYVEPAMPEGSTGVVKPAVTRPRPGHADLAGAMKYGHEDIRDVLERASARETTMRVAIGGIARQLLSHFGIRIASHVTTIGDVSIPAGRVVSFAEAEALPDDGPLHCVDAAAEERMKAAIDKAGKAGDTLGGAFEVIVTGLPVGLGSYVQWDRRLDGRLAQALCSIQAIKGCEFGLGFETARRPGSAVHDEILFDTQAGFKRTTNNAGGLEGGVTNGQPVIVRAAMKPLSTLRTPLKSVDLATKEAVEAVVERSDVCAVPAAGIVGEAMVAIVLADAFLEKFGGDSLEEVRRNYEAYLGSLKDW